MSNSTGQGADDRVRFLSVALAVVMGLFWAFLIAGIWYFFKMKGAGYEGTLLNWFARFHILLVHLPIGMIFMVIAMEIFGKVKGFATIRDAVPFTLWLTLVGAIGTTVLGFLLMEIEEFSGRAMTLHMWTGLGVVVLTLFALVFRLKNHSLGYSITLILSALCIAAASHYGGSMTHEADYLSEFAPAPLKPVLLAGLENPNKASHKGPQPINPDQLVYDDYIAPVMEKTCNECHNANKIKGKLRTDTHELLMAGSKESDYQTIVPGNADDSELIVRVTLDPEDEEFMPTKGDPLIQEEIDLLILWINAGAKTDTRVADLGDAAHVTPLITAVAAALEADAKAAMAKWEDLSPKERQYRLDTVMESAEKLKILVGPVSAEDDRIKVDLLNAAARYGDKQLAKLEPIAGHIVELNLDNSQITDQGLASIAKMDALEKLHLEKTAITDQGIAQLAYLKQLSYLNLNHTEVTNELFSSISALTKLKKLLVWQTNIDPAKAKAYEQHVNLEVITQDISEQPKATPPEKRPTPPAPKPAEPKKTKAEPTQVKTKPKQATQPKQPENKPPKAEN